MMAAKASAMVPSMDVVKTSLPSEITVQAIPGGCAYRLPWRDVPPVLWKVVGQLGAVGAIAVGIAVGLFYILFGGGKDSFVFTMGIFVTALGLLAVGAAVCFLYTRCVLEADGNELRLQDWYGPIKTELKRPLPMIRKVVTHYLVIGKPKEGEYVTPETPLDEAGEPKYGALEIICEGAQNLFTAHTYPRPWLLCLGAELANRLQVPHEVAPLDGDPPQMISFFPLTNLLEDSDTFDEPTPPPDNAWLAHVNEGVLTLTLPPPGFLREGNGFSLLFGGFFFLLGFAFLLSAIPRVIQEPTGLLFPLILLGTSAGFLIFGYRRAYSSVTLTVNADQLHCHRVGPLGMNKHETWVRGEIAALRVGPGKQGREKGVDRKAVYLHLAGGKQQWLVETARAQDMRWVATILRKTLDVPAVAQPAQPA
jgi:hypothetical protein